MSDLGAKDKRIDDSLTEEMLKEAVAGIVDNGGQAPKSKAGEAQAIAAKIAESEKPSACPSCFSELSEDAGSFCTECGFSLKVESETKYCSMCGKVSTVSESTNGQCSRCGTSFNSPLAEADDEEDDEEEDDDDEKEVSSERGNPDDDEEKEDVLKDGKKNEGWSPAEVARFAIDQAFELDEEGIQGLAASLIWGED